MNNYKEWETSALLDYLFELGEAKCSGTWITPVGEAKLNELEEVRKKVTEEILCRVGSF